MRLLVVSPFRPDQDATHGGGQYLGALCDALAERAELGLVTFARGGKGAKANRCFSFGLDVPLVERPSGRGKWRHQMRMARHWGLRGLPLVAAKHWHPEMPKLLRRAVAEFRPDAALVELAQMAQYLPFLAGLPTVFTDHESGQPANAHTDLGAWADRRDLRLWRRYVQKFYPQAALLQAVTAEDAADLTRALGRPVVTRLPTIRMPAEPVDPEQAPPRALFLGSYEHFPNPEAARVLVRDVLPLVRQRVRGAELWFAGSAADRIRDLGEVDGVRVVGFAKDLGALFATVRVVLAPLYSGGGFRMKSLAAVAHGVPVVTNALGARGAAIPAPARTIAEDAAGLAAATAELLESPQKAATAGAAAFAWARANLCADAVAQSQLERVQQLL